MIRSEKKKAIEDKVLHEKLRACQDSQDNLPTTK